MLRDKNLVPLSRQHQHALALCVRLDRALQAREIDVEAWQAEIVQIVEQEIKLHFAAEETEIFPAAQDDAELEAVVKDLVEEHAVLRNLFARAADRTLDPAGLRTLVEVLSGHIRKEERQLFEGLQQRLSHDRLASIGKALDQALADTSNACMMPNEVTRLKPKS